MDRAMLTSEGYRHARVRRGRAAVAHPAAAAAPASAMLPPSLPPEKAAATRATPSRLPREVVASHPFWHPHRRLPCETACQGEALSAAQRRRRPASETSSNVGSFSERGGAKPTAAPAVRSHGAAQTGHLNTGRVACCRNHRGGGHDRDTRAHPAPPCHLRQCQCQRRLGSRTQTVRRLRQTLPHFELLLSQIRKQAGMPLPAEQAHSSALQSPLQRPPHVPSLPQPLLPQLPIEPQPAPFATSMPATGRPRHAELATRSMAARTRRPPMPRRCGGSRIVDSVCSRSPALPLPAAPAHGPQASSWQPPAQKAASSMQLAATNEKQAPPNDLHGQVALAPLPPRITCPRPTPPQPSQRFQSNQRACHHPLPQQPRPSARGG